MGNFTKVVSYLLLQLLSCISFVERLSLLNLCLIAAVPQVAEAQTHRQASCTGREANAAEHCRKECRQNEQTEHRRTIIATQVARLRQCKIALGQPLSLTAYCHLTVFRLRVCHK